MGIPSQEQRIPGWSPDTFACLGTTVSGSGGRRRGVVVRLDELPYLVHDLRVAVAESVQEPAHLRRRHRRDRRPGAAERGVLEHLLESGLVHLGQCRPTELPGRHSVDLLPGKSLEGDHRSVVLDGRQLDGVGVGVAERGVLVDGAVRSVVVHRFPTFVVESGRVPLDSGIYA